MEKSSKSQTVVPYLVLPDASKFLVFAIEVFGASESFKVMRDENTIQHAELKIGESTIMFADTTEEFPVQPAALTVYVANVDETFNKAVKAGATVVMKLSDQQYGRIGGVKDPFGNTWWLMTAK